MRNTNSKLKLKSKLQIYITILITLFTFQILITNSVLYAQAGNDYSLGCFITLRGEITCSDTGMAPEQTKISVFDANSNNTLVKEVIIHGGTYELNLDSGVYRLDFSSDGYTTRVSEMLTISRESVLKYDVTLTKGGNQGNIVFTIKDENGMPYSNCEVILSYYENNHLHNIINPLYTDEKGRCLIYWDLKERNYTVNLYSAELSSRWQKTIAWTKSTAEVLNDGYLPNEYYNILIEFRRDAALHYNPASITLHR